MLCKLLILILASKTTVAQMNGEFWWLSDKVTKLKGVEAPPPKFEELGEFDTDESAKIIFRDEDSISPDNTFEETNAIDSEMNKKLENSLEGSGYIVWPDDTIIQPTVQKNDQFKQFPSVINIETATKKVPSHTKLRSEDVIIFKYENDNNVISIPPTTHLIKQSARQNITIPMVSKPVDKKEKIKLNKTAEEHTKIQNTDSFSFKFPDDNLLPKPTSEPPKKIVTPKDDQKNVMIDKSNEIINSMRDKTALRDTTPKENTFSENICTYMEKNMCYQKNGLIYKSKKESVKNVNIDELVCCILIIQTVDPYGILFPDSTEIQPHRFRRSNKEHSPSSSTNQRDFLLRQRYRPQSVKPTSLTKVVTPEDNDYVDPYLNIKGSSLRKQSTHSSRNQDCNYPDYVEDYVVELPKPGLVGLYSDNGQRPPWSFSNENGRPSYGGSDDVSEEDDEPSFGYSTVDPRRGSSTKVPKRGRPMKLTTNSPEEVAYDVESHTVSFQSTPNFQVLQGFKLLNLGRNRNKFYSKNTKRGTTEGNVESSIESERLTTQLNSNLGDQVYENCGSSRKLIDIDRNDKQLGEAENGSHPWMALVVLTRQPQGILCYATIIHPRAAVTAGDCVYGRSSPKEVTLIAGLWNLRDRSRTQNRVVTVQMHPQYRPKVLGHDLALLHWKTPLKLNANIQPACLGNLLDTDDCKFFGWGGFDQGIRLRSRWQQASVLSAQECGARLSNAVVMPDDAFCAKVQTGGTVTGLGGSLICDVNGRKATSGVAVWRDSALILIPAHEWILRAFQDLDLE